MKGLSLKTQRYYIHGKLQVELSYKPIYSEDNGVRFNTSPRKYYTDDRTIQMIILTYGEIITINYDGVLHFIPIRSPTEK